MRKQRANRRRKEPVGQRALKRARRAGRIILVAILLPTTLYACYRAYDFVTTTPALSVDEITVLGTERVEPGRVMELAGAIDGRNIFSFDVDDVRASVEGEPWIERAVVKRRPPHRLEIEITERRPLTLVRLAGDGGLYVMDAGGVVFKKLSSADELVLPVVTGLVGSEEGSEITERALLVLMGLMKDREGFNLDSVSEIHLDPVYGISLYTVGSGVRLELGINRFEEKLAAFETIVQARSGDLGGVISMDLGNVREVIVRFDSSVAKEGGVI
jgi:cell division protein FtsQ